MKQRFILIVAALAATIALGGCWEEDAPWADTGGAFDWDDDYDSNRERQIEVSTAALAGDMGAIRAFDVVGDPNLSHGFVDGYGDTNLTVTAHTDTGALVMAIMYISDGVLQQPSGETVTYQAFEAGPDNEFVEVTGCSGPDGMIDFDVPADQVEITVNESDNDPSARVVNFVATFDSEHGTQRTAGSFEIPGSTAPQGTTAPF